MNKINMNETIMSLRKKRGMTQDELAERLGVSNQAVSKWETAQCCPDIGLIPDIAELFGVSIDELFGRSCGQETYYELCAELPWVDDGTVRIFEAVGKKILKSQNADEPFEIIFPAGASFKIEVYGDLHCDADISGDVSCDGDVNCADIDGDVSCDGDVNCADIGGDVSCDGDVICAGIGGDVSCDGDVICAGIGGDVSCRGRTVDRPDHR